jgi:hypothetical protein
MATLAAALPGEAGASLGTEVFYCPNPACPVAYYDAWGNTVPAASLERPAYPKDSGGPVCSCLGIGAEEIAAEAGKGLKDLLLRILEHIRTGEAACERRAPDGRSCERTARRLFLEAAPEKRG